MSRFSKIFLLGAIGLPAAVVACSCATNPKAPSSTGQGDSTISDVVLVYTYKIINKFPHDPNAFTQGLVFEGGALYEGTGLCGHSSLREVKLETGDTLRVLELPVQYFGEGITIHDDRVIQLTYHSHVGFVYDKESFDLMHEFNYSTQGWGITHDGTHLIMSDGTSTLYLLDPATFEDVGQIEVSDSIGPVTYLNELEYINGEIYANIWNTDLIAIISPQSGNVAGWIDLEGLLRPEDITGRIDVLNGIAYDTDGDRLFVTGKYWPKLFEIELIVQK